MKVLVSYIDFHWDNHQGGSGKSFEMTMSVTLPEDLKAQEFKKFICACLEDTLKNTRPFKQDNKASIIKIEIV